MTIYDRVSLLDLFTQLNIDGKIQYRSHCLHCFLGFDRHSSPVSHSQRTKSTVKMLENMFIMNVTLGFYRIFQSDSNNVNVNICLLLAIVRRRTCFHLCFEKNNKQTCSIGIAFLVGCVSIYINGNLYLDHNSRVLMLESYAFFGVKNFDLSQSIIPNLHT
jgi:hypothetical protein